MKKKFVFYKKESLGNTTHLSFCEISGNNIIMRSGWYKGDYEDKNSMDYTGMTEINLDEFRELIKGFSHNIEPHERIEVPLY